MKVSDKIFDWCIKSAFRDGQIHQMTKSPEVSSDSDLSKEADELAMKKSIASIRKMLGEEEK